MQKLTITNYGKDKPYLGRESDFQKMAIKFIYQKYNRTKVIAYHCPNGGYRNSLEAARFKAEGVISGIPDIIVDTPMNGWPGARFELKNKKGKVTDNQNKILLQMQDHGYFVGVVWGMDGLIEALKIYFEY